MKTMGFLISNKAGERRRALLPDHAVTLSEPSSLYIERGYGAAIGISDEAYTQAGMHIASREECLACDVITDVSLGAADYLDMLVPGKILFGWAHAVQRVDFTTKVIDNAHTVIAWEDLYENGRYLFYKNREIAGEAAILHAIRYCGKMPYETKVAVLGNGQVAKGALRVLYGLGAEVDVYDKRLEKLFMERMYEYDVLVNCVLWDTNRTDRIIYADDLKKMKPGTLIIDISCDPHLEIETSHPTTIDDPVYVVDGVIHYAVDNTPAMFPITVSRVLSNGLLKYLEPILCDELDAYPETLKSAIVIRDGHILDERITTFRKSRNLICK